MITIFSHSQSSLPLPSLSQAIMSTSDAEISTILGLYTLQAQYYFVDINQGW